MQGRGAREIHPTVTSRESLHCEGSLAGRQRDLEVDGVGHEHLHASASADHASLLHRFREDAKSVVQGALRLVQQMRAGPAQDDGAGGAGLAAREADEAVFADHDFVNQSALAEGDELGPVEGGGDLPSAQIYTEEGQFR